MLNSLRELKGGDRVAEDGMQLQRQANKAKRRSSQENVLVASLSQLPQIEREIWS